MANVSIVETSKLLPWLMLTAILSGLALGTSIMTVVVVQNSNAHLAEQYRITERESRVTQERLSDMKVELVKHGIAESDH